MPTGKRLAPMLGELVPMLRRFGELDIDDDTAALLVAMSPATIDRRLAPDERKHELKGRSHTKPGSLLKVRSRSAPGRTGTTRCPGSSRSTWSATRAATPPVSTLHADRHRHRHRLDGEPRVRNKARKWVLAALEHRRHMPFPLLGIDSDNGSEFINHTCSTGASRRRSPSPGPGRATPTTAATSSRRTGRSYAPWSATTATTPRQSCCC